MVLRNFEEFVNIDDLLKFRQKGISFYYVLFLPKHLISPGIKYDTSESNEDFPYRNTGTSKDINEKELFLKTLDPSIKIHSKTMNASIKIIFQNFLN